MRRIGKGNKIVKNCIVWAMSAMIAVGSIAPAQVVRAEGTEQTGIESTEHDNKINTNYGCPDQTDSSVTPSPAADNNKYHNDEAAANAANTEKIVDMTGKADKAVKDANDAKQAAEDAQNKLDQLQGTNGNPGEVVNASTDVNNAKSAADTAQTDAATAKTDVDKIDDTITDINNYNTAGSNVDNAVNGINNGAASATVISATNDASQSALVASQSASSAQTGVAALGKKDQKKVTVDDVKAAADTAITAADAAQDAATKVKAAVAAAAADTTSSTRTQDTAAAAKTAIDTALTVAEAAKATAEAAKNIADNALDKATKVDTDKVNDEVINYVKEVRKAATAADTAVTAAKTAVDAAEDALLEQIKIYNANAAALGLDPYADESGSVYKDKDGNIPGYDVSNKIDAAALGTAQATLTADIAKAGAEVAAAQTSLTAAKSAKDTAQTSLNTANDALTAANQFITKVSNYQKSAQTNTDDVNKVLDTDYTDLAKTQLNVSKATLEDKKAETKNAEGVVIAKSNAVDAAQNELDKAKGEAKKKAEIAYNSLPDWEKALGRFSGGKDAFIEDAVASAVEKESKALTDANNELANANTELTKCNQAEDEAQTKVSNDQASVDAIEKCKDEATDVLYNSIIEELRKQSDIVNQTEYDYDSNEWANKNLSLEQIASSPIDSLGISISKLQVRCAIDHSAEYGNISNSKTFEELLRSLLKDIINPIPGIQGAVSTKTQSEIMQNIIKASKNDMTKYNEEIQAIRANMALEKANTANTAATDVDKKIKDNKYAETLGGLTTAMGTSEDAITSETVNGKINAAQSDYDNANETLKNLRASSMNANKSKDLLSAIRDAQKKVNSAKEALVEAKAAAASADNYKLWADELIKKQYTMAFGQAAIDANGNTLDKNGKTTTNKSEFVTATDNGRDFDNKGDSSVVHEDPKYFTYNLATTTVEVPYSIYRAYVQRMYKQYNYSESKNGKGIATSDSASGEATTMPIILWAIDENGKLTGESYTLENAPAGKTYFIGYTFKHESDGYHIDGTQYTTPEPEPTPEPTTIVTTISNAPTALAAAPAVLGARRTPEATPVADTDKAVLGAKRGAATGDDSNAAGWIALMICTMGAGAAVVLGRRKEQENAQ